MKDDFEITDEERMASTIFDDVTFSSAPDWQSLHHETPDDEADVDTKAASNASMQPSTSSVRTAVQMDLKPVINAFETALQRGGEVIEIDWPAVIETTLNNGGNLEAALMQAYAASFFEGLGMTQEQVSELLTEAIATTEPSN
jgi:hypothetical protein